MTDLKNKMKSINQKEIIDYLKKEFDKDAAIYLVLLLGILYLGFTKLLMPSFVEISTTSTKYLQTKQAVEQMQLRLDRRNQASASGINITLPKEIYEPPVKSADLKTASVEIIEFLINLIKASGVKRIDQIYFTEERAVDSIGVNAEDYKILRINLNLISRYSSLQDFLNEIYLLKYIIDIKALSVTPAKNLGYDYINAALTLDLYVKVK